MSDQIHIRGRRYERYTVRGRLTADHPTGAGATADLTLLDRRGRMHRLPWAAFGARPEEGHDLTAVWLVRHDRSSGPYVAVHNHTTAERWHNDRALARLHRPTWVLLAACATGAVVGLAPLGWALVLAGGMGWWIGGIAGGRLLKASGALLAGAGTAAGQGRRETPSSTMSRGTA